MIVHGNPELRTTGEWGERRWGKRGSPRWARDCGSGQGGPSQGECLLFIAAERS